MLGFEISFTILSKSQEQTLDWSMDRRQVQFIARLTLREIQPTFNDRTKFRIG